MALSNASAPRKCLTIRSRGSIRYNRSKTDALLKISSRPPRSRRTKKGARVSAQPPSPLKTDAQPAVPALQITGEQVAIGAWKADQAEVIATSLDLSDLIRQARTEEAVELLQGRQIEGLAALVALDARDVVDNLPPIVLSELVAAEDARIIE